MKKRSAAIVLAALSLLIAICGAAAAADTYVPHAERIVSIGDKLYGLAAYRAGAKYSPSKVIEFDASLQPARSVDLIDGPETGLNAGDMIVHDGKLYITCIGGWQTVSGTQGNIWEVDPSGAQMSAKMLADTATHPYFKDLENAQIYGISAAADGTVFIPIQTSGYTTPGDTNTYFATGKIMITTISALVNDRTLGNVSIDLGKVDHPFGSMWQEDQALLWVNHTGTLKGFTRTGVELPGAKVSEQTLGARLYEMAAVPSIKGIVYAACNYAGDGAGATAMGTVISGDAGVTAKKTFSGATVTDLGMYAFKNKSGDDRIMLLERSSGTSNRDRIFVWNGTNGLEGAPNVNKAIDAENTHGVAALDDSLFVATYENPRDGNSGAGEFVKLDMANEYARTASYALANVQMVDGAMQIPPAQRTRLGLDGISTDMDLVQVRTRDAITAKASEIEASDLEVVGGVVSITEDAAQRIAGIMGLGSSCHPLGAFTAKSISGGRIAVEYDLLGEQLLATRPQDVKVVKVKSSSDAEKNALFEFVQSGTGAADKDGAFMVVSKSWSAVDRISQGVSYKLILIIKDNGKYDIDTDPGSVIDPSFIAGASGITPPASGGGGGGGCAAGTCATLAAAALVFCIRRRRA